MKEYTKNNDSGNLLKAGSTMNLSIDTVLDLILMLRRINEQAVKQLEFLEQNKNK